MKKLIFIFAIALFACNTFAQTRGFVQTRKQAKDYVALVIGNSQYTGMQLANPVNDAADVAKTFDEMGFIVEKVLDADKEQMTVAIQEFSKKMTTARAAVFYFAGHGMQVDGQNYLIPIARTNSDEITNESQVSYRAINAGEILSAMENNHVKFAMVVLDACRNNPIKGTGRGKIKGLAAIDAPVGSLVMYATKAGDVAADGTGRNSPFTTAFLQNITTPGLDVNLLPSRITKTVNQLTNGAQTPGSYMQLTESFTFVPELSDKDLQKMKEEKERLANELKQKRFASEQERIKQQQEYDRLIAEINKVENYDEELADIERKKNEVNELDKQIEKMKKQNADGVDNLDAMLQIIADRKKRNDELEELKRKAEQERIRKQQELKEKQRLAEKERQRKEKEIRALKQRDYNTNMAKYNKIANSEFGQDLKASAWNTVLKNLGISAQIAIGDSTAVKENIGLTAKLEKTLTVNIAGLNINLQGVQGGTFQMGSNDGESDEKPVHTVQVDNFYMSKYEVTFNEYDQFCDATNRDKPSDNGWGRGNRPVINVSWNDAVAYAEWLSNKTGQNWRLPTEAEWEYAAHGGNQSKGYKYSGSDNIKEVAEYEGNNNKSTKPVGGKQPNELGIYDMSGNVWEWCSDWKDAYSSSTQVNPTGPSSGSGRVLRGGSWRNLAQYCRVAYRNDSTPDYRDYFYGFRLVLVP